MSDPTKPSLSLLCKLGSIAVHVEESMSTKAHAVDIAAMQALIRDPEVREWIKSMGPFMPVKR